MNDSMPLIGPNSSIQNHSGDNPIAEAPEKSPKRTKMKNIANKIKGLAKWTLLINIFGAAATSAILSAITIAAIAGCAAYFVFVVLPMIQNLAQFGSIAGGASLPTLGLCACAL